MPGISSVISRPVTDTASAFVATPLEEGLRIVGIAEFDTPDAPRDPKQSNKLVAYAHAMLPDLRVGEVNHWMGVRPSTPDSLPVIGPHPDHANILFATGPWPHGNQRRSNDSAPALLRLLTARFRRQIFILRRA